MLGHEQQDLPPAEEIGSDCVNTCYSARAWEGKDGSKTDARHALPRQSTRHTINKSGVCTKNTTVSLLRAHLFRSVVKDVALAKVSSTTLLDKKATTLQGPVCCCIDSPYFACSHANVLSSAHHSPSCDVQTNQLRLSARQYGDDAPNSFGVEYDASGHLRLDGHVAIDAECRISQNFNRIEADTQAHIIGELVDSRTQHHSRGRRIVERSNEFT